MSRRIYNNPHIEPIYKSKCNGAIDTCVCHELIKSKLADASNNLKKSNLKSNSKRSTATDSTNSKQIVYSPATHWAFHFKRECSCGCGETITAKDPCVRQPLVFGGWYLAFKTKECLERQVQKNFVNYSHIRLKNKSEILKEEYVRFLLAERFFGKFKLDFTGYAPLELSVPGANQAVGSTSGANQAVGSTNGGVTQKRAKKENHIVKKESK